MLISYSNKFVTSFHYISRKTLLKHWLTWQTEVLVLYYLRTTMNLWTSRGNSSITVKWITSEDVHGTKKPVTTMLTYPWKCTVLHCNHLGNTWKPLVLMTRHFDYCPSASEGDNQSVRSSAPVVSRCFPGGYNVKLYISRGRLACWLLAFLHSGSVYIANFNCKLFEKELKTHLNKCCYDWFSTM